MGMIVNPSNGLLQDALNSKIYVDKTLIIRELNEIINTRNKFVCISRPRRFGKSMAKGLLMAYYSRGCNSEAMFKNLKIANEPSFKTHLNKYNVIAIDCNSFRQYLFKEGDESFVNMMTLKIKNEFIKEFSDVDFSDCRSIADCIQNVYMATGIRFVILIDEYDLPVREELPKKLFQEYLDFLISLFKDETTIEAVALAYITGILPIVREKTESKLNNFREITFLKPRNFAEFTGFTEQEVKELCDKYDISYKDCLKWYQGYTVSGIHICNPHAVVECITNREFSPYWSNTGTYETFAPYIKGNFQGIKDDLIKMLAGGNVPVTISRFTNMLSDLNSKDNVFTYLMHIGFLAYNPDDQTCRMPNLETQDIWGAALENSDSFKVIGEFIKNSQRLLRATLAKDSETVAKALEAVHEEVTSQLSYNHEQSMQSGIYIAYMYAKTYYTIFYEVPSGKGVADMLFMPLYPNWPAMIIELKRNTSPNSALKQIKAKNYPARLQNYKGNLLFVGVSYDKNKKHRCVFEECEIGN